MIDYTFAKTEEDLKSILVLQTINLPGSISAEEALEQGFVTVVHDLDLLREMNSPYPHTIAKESDQVIGYTLSMTVNFTARIPVLIPFMERLQQMEWAGHSVTDVQYVLMGQVCVARDYRGQGVFKGLYRKMQEQMAPHFELIITEISERNPRSLWAHKKVGFVEMTRYQAPDGERWVVVGIDCSLVD
jgi:GNAT superfamily N-acetyltransferase